MIKVQVKGLNKVRRYLSNLGPRINKQIMKAGDEFTGFVQKSAKLRAPRMTGELARSIKKKKGRKHITVFSDSPYAAFQEFGFKPHWVHAGTSTRNSAGTIGAAYNVSGFLFVKKHTPFILPAFEMGISQLPNLIERKMAKALK